MYVPAAVFGKCSPYALRKSRYVNSPTVCSLAVVLLVGVRTRRCLITNLDESDHLGRSRFPTDRKNVHSTEPRGEWWWLDRQSRLYGPFESTSAAVSPRSNGYAVCGLQL
jgi:hypothetical protein